MQNGQFFYQFHLNSSYLCTNSVHSPPQEFTHKGKQRKYWPANAPPCAVARKNLVNFSGASTIRFLYVFAQQCCQALKLRARGLLGQFFQSAKLCSKVFLSQKLGHENMRRIKVELEPKATLDGRTKKVAQQRFCVLDMGPLICSYQEGESHMYICSV